MAWYWWVPIIYVVGFSVTFVINNSGPIMPGLALLRAIVWPYWMVTGRPFGQRLPMD